MCLVPIFGNGSATFTHTNTGRGRRDGYSSEKVSLFGRRSVWERPRRGLMNECKIRPKTGCISLIFLMCCCIVVPYIFLVEKTCELKANTLFQVGKKSKLFQTNFVDFQTNLRFMLRRLFVRKKSLGGSLPIDSILNSCVSRDRGRKENRLL